ncbi:tRNA epoxyqueuosine(34) reductase QueG [Saccharicrinis fermentans]|uniref:Epoxyqueuosine reductase n=1 Tax=Saccharicrinis fermentans DSM 9555 = JCM 21142 TaxID=869213 RepID=W7XYC7_9BACT|nr:tRNA epoxyqueuosine(34) reductase QueG [Saccharicrinis fermentans]GAF03595.1 epoxyqueuosine reductase [Saccharicrinis fermentans DSM 9555 = JCM 21142]
MDVLKGTYSQLIESKAKDLGFDACGFTQAEELTAEKEILKKWLDNHMHGNMHYMANHFEKRVNPSKLVEGAKTVIVLLTNYTPKEKQSHPDAPIIARYAYGQDYHYVIKDQLKQLYSYIKDEIYPSLEGRYFVDSAPVLERSLAVRAGLGWIGKNTHLIHKKLGSYVFISELIINLTLPPSEPIKEACGGCTRCIDACPTQALTSPQTLDARKCISYLTIENKESIPQEFSGKMENRVFGCDICQEVCPWTWKSRPHTNEKLKAVTKILELTKERWQELTAEEFSEIFRKSAVKRAKYTGLKRNIEFLLSKK